MASGPGAFFDGFLGGLGGASPKTQSTKVPKKPKLDDRDYALGQDPNWLAQFGQGTAQTGADATKLTGYGQGLATSAQDAQSRATPETQFGRSQAVGAQQTGAADWLSQFAQGPQGPSAAQAQLQQGANQSMDQGLALARSGSGFGESAAGLDSAQRANAGTMANLSNQSAILRAQEDQAFRAQQLQAMSGAADIYGSAAGREAGQAQFLTDAELQAQQQRDALQLGLGEQSIGAQNLGIQGQTAAQGMNLDAASAELGARVDQGNTAANLYGTSADIFAERNRRDEALRESRRADRNEVIGAVGGIAGAVGGMLSDERAKKNARNTSLRARYAALSD